MDINIMIEAQNGANWARWQRLARAVEDLGFAGLYRSDHFTNGGPPDKDSLEAWVSLTWLASNTSRINFGTLVSPSAFRHPAMLARMAAAVDDLSGGRLRLGLGAGWQEREHTNYGLPLLKIPQRFDRFEEYLAVVTQLLRSDDPVDFTGSYYTLQEAILLPRPQRQGGSPITVGGNGPIRTLPLVARFADEWNYFGQDYQTRKKLNNRLNWLLEENGRSPGDVRRTMMMGVTFAVDDADLKVKLTKRGMTLEQAQQSPGVTGTPSMVQDQLKMYANQGLDGVMLQWMDLDDIDGLKHFAKAVL